MNRRTLLKLLPFLPPAMWALLQNDPTPRFYGMSVADAFGPLYGISAFPIVKYLQDEEYNVLTGRVE